MLISNRRKLEGVQVMSKRFSTEQEEFWSGNFGVAYSERNRDPRMLCSNTALFSSILRHTSGIHSIIEFGANVGFNLKSIDQLIADADLAGVEINEKAAQSLREWGRCAVHAVSVLEFTPTRQWDLAFTKGLLIHVNPARLPDVYNTLVQSSRRYVCVVEYYSPTPVTIPYRGNEQRLFKRDFAGEILDIYPSMELVDYGFCYHRDACFPQDDVTWFLLRKGETP